MKFELNNSEYQKEIKYALKKGVDINPNQFIEDILTIQVLKLIIVDAATIFKSNFKGKSEEFILDNCYDERISLIATQYINKSKELGIDFDKAVIWGLRSVGVRYDDCGGAYILHVEDFDKKSNVLKIRFNKSTILEVLKNIKNFTIELRFDL